MAHPEKQILEATGSTLGLIKHANYFSWYFPLTRFTRLMPFNITSNL